jgi:cytidine deaminase
VKAEAIAVQSLSPAWRDLLEAASQARELAYAPYSQFAVGAAVRTASGKVYTGSNVENASSGLTVCAERVAIWQAVAAGERGFTALAVITAPGATPCGACRQVLVEFVAELPILVADTAGHAWLTDLQTLLPDAFPRIIYGTDSAWRAADRAAADYVL